MSLIRGDNVLVAEYVALIDAYVPYGCARDCSLSLVSEVIDTTVKGSGKFRTYKPAAMTYALSIGGLVNINDTNLLSLHDLRAKQIAQTEVMVLYQRTAEDGSIYSETGNYLIVESEDSASYNGINSYSVKFQGTGPLTQSFTPTEIVGNVKRFEYTGIAGETTFTNVKNVATGATITLAGKTVLGLEIDGIGYSKMITAGTPTAKEFKFNNITGRFDVPVTMDEGIEAFGYYR